MNLALYSVASFESYEDIRNSQETNQAVLISVSTAAAVANRSTIVGANPKLLSASQQKVHSERS